MARLFTFLDSTARKLRRATRLQAAGKATQAFSLLARLAEAGVAEAAFRVGQCYLSGQGTVPSLEDGARWTWRAATEGITEACFTLATLYAMGLPPGFDPARLDPGDLYGRGKRDEEDEQYPPDFEQARLWAEKGAAAGHAESQALLGHVFSHGPEGIRNRDLAREHYRQAVKAGSLQGCLGLGLILLDEAEGDDQRGQAVALLKQAAEGGVGVANAAMGWICERGAVGQERDLQQAGAYYYVAAEQDIPAAQARYGLMLLKGIGVEANVVQAESWLRRAAYGGDAEAAALLGDMYIRGEDLLRRPLEAARWYQFAAEQGHTPAARVLAVLYLTATGVVRDRKKAAHWFSFAAALGDAKADADLGNLVLAGLPHPIEEQQRLQDRIRKQAETGDPLSAFNLGVCLAQGIGGSPDETKALYWLGLAREGVVNAQYWYGRLFFEGRGVPVDYQQGFMWMDKAAQQGMPEACISVAQLLVTGHVHGHRDHERALVLYHKAAEAGMVEAFFSLGAMYGGGHDVPVDLARARAYFTDAAKRNHGLGQMMLGRYLLKGIGGPRELPQARYWLRHALGNGVEQAKPLLDEAVRLSGGAAAEGPASKEPASTQPDAGQEGASPGGQRGSSEETGTADKGAR